MMPRSQFHSAPTVALLTCMILGICISLVSSCPPTASQLGNLDDVRPKCPVGNTFTRDNIPPTVNCPSAQTFTSSSGQPIPVTYTQLATGTDTSGGQVTFTYSPASGSTFNVGTTPVTARGRDPSGNMALCSFNIIVNTDACNDIRIVTRAEWGARAPKSVQNMNTPVPYAFVHHTDGTSCHSIEECSIVVRSIQNYHMDNNGWNDIGYSFLVGEDGNIYEGRGWDRVGAHTFGYNDNGLAWSFMGSFMTQLPYQAALTAGRKAIECGLDLRKLTTSYTLRGHRDMNTTLCPGDQLYEEILNWPHY